MTAPKILVYPARGAHSTSWKAEVHTPGVRYSHPRTREYIGCMGSRASAVAAAEHFIRTGEKPDPAPRGPKICNRSRGTYKPGPKAPPAPTPAPDAKALRLEMIRRIAGRLA